MFYTCNHSKGIQIIFVRIKTSKNEQFRGLIPLLLALNKPMIQVIESFVVKDDFFGAKRACYPD
jgi:hypothetical protein